MQPLIPEPRDESGTATFERLGPRRTWLRLDDDGAGCWIRSVMVCAVIDGHEVGEQATWGDYAATEAHVEAMFTMLEKRVGDVIAQRLRDKSPNSSTSS